MVYVDTSVLVALIVPEPHSAAVARWYGRTRSVLASAAWCVPEFASALGIKQRTAQIDAPQALLAWQRFGAPLPDPWQPPPFRAWPSEAA